MTAARNAVSARSFDAAADVQHKSHGFRGSVCVEGTSSMLITDYIAIGILVACMLGAGAMAISRGKS
jgi:hypothetical protein